ncbi:MAG: hypothetical protein HRU07_07775 [Nitrosopumilus sp.]|nr:hypothetical protein [Nitrosopumilus sp.]NRA06037.1 hypothetical protein [Nitrosopumilus sp.]
MTSSVIVGITYVEATAGDQLLTINNPTPEDNDALGYSITSTPNGDLLVGAPFDNTGATSTGAAYLFDGTTGNLLLTLNNPTPGDYDYFGYSVASTPDGNLLVGAY